MATIGSTLRFLASVGFAIALTACGGGGGSGSASPASQQNMPPAARISASVTSGGAPLTVSFDASTSSDADGSITAYAWDFGDGATATGVSTSHTYSQNGTFTARLTITDNRQAQGTATQSIQVQNQAPVARFTATPMSGAAPLTVAFDGRTSTDADGSIATYSWNFGDSTTGSGATTAHTYASNGSFSVRLTVTDNGSLQNSTTQTIQVGGSFTLSGTVRILSTSAIDSDINDASTQPVSNSTFVTAQPVLNPVTVGGYVNVPNAGPNGPLFATGDRSDYFTVSLAGNETIVLAIGEADPMANDLDLYVYDSNQTLVDSSISGNQATESVTINAAGQYFVRVNAFSGASNYALSVGQTAPTAVTASSYRLSDEFVPGELIAEFSDTAAAQTVVATLGMQVKAGSPAGPQLLRIDDVAQATQGFSANMHSVAASAVQRSKLDTLMAAKMLSKRKDVRTVDPNFIRLASATPNDPFFNTQWHLRDIGLSQAWDVTTGSPNVIVAVIDTGARFDHPDLQGQLIPGYDFISDVARANDGDGRDGDATDPGDRALGGTSSFHGTHVIGTVGARTNNGVGVSGVAWNVRIMPLRVLGVDGGTSFEVIEAVRYAARLSNVSGQLPNERADVINMSLGGGSFSQSEQNNINQARAAGVIIVAAAGNESTATPSYPASYSGVVSVSATDITRGLARYSNFGINIDIAAPGGDSRTDINGDGSPDGVLSTLAQESGNGSIAKGYGWLNGTSMASPHVAGVIALMKSIYPGLTPAEFDGELASGTLTDDLGAPGRDNQFGFGIVNANKAVARASALANQSGGGSNAFVFTTPSAVTLGAVLGSFSMAVQNAGTNAASIVSITDNQPWLTVTPTTVDSNGFGSYRLVVNRQGLADGTYSATVAVDSTANDVNVPITMQVASFNTSSDAGPHYVLAINSATDQVVTFTRVVAQQGSYAYSLPNLAAGTYRVVAGTDMDNDNFICDAGEACGVYRDVDTPETVTIIDRNINGLDFTSGFRALFDATGNATAPQSIHTFPMKQPSAAKLRAPHEVAR